MSLDPPRRWTAAALLVGALSCAAGRGDDGPAACAPTCAPGACGDDGCGGTCGPCGDSFACAAGTCTALHRCAPGEYLTFIVYTYVSGTGLVFEADPATCASTSGSGACDPAEFVCALAAGVRVTEVYDGCVLEQVSTCSQPFCSFTFSPPVKVPGTCFADWRGTYEGPDARIVLGGPPHAMTITGTIVGESLPFDGPVRGLLVDAKLSAILTTNQTFFQLEADLDPATATLRGKFCYSYSQLSRSACVDFWARRAAA